MIIKIRLILDEHGNWNAHGWGKAGGECEWDDMSLIDGMPCGCHESWYFVEVDVPMPSAATLQGTLKRSEA